MEISFTKCSSFCLFILPPVYPARKSIALLFSKTISLNEPQNYEAWTHMQEVKEDRILEVKIEHFDGK
jgi:hypothetical protein